LGNKNTITLSSLEQENIGIVYCIQRYISIYNENIIEPQEIPLNIYYEDESYIYAYMVIITIALIQGVHISNIKSKIISENPLVKSIYESPENPIFELFYLEGAKAVIADFSGNPPIECSL